MRIAESDLALRSPIDTGPAEPIGWSPEAGERLDRLIGRLGGLSEAARIAGKSDDALMRWRRGTARWDCWSVGRLCAAAGESLDYLVFGSRPGSVTDLVRTDAVRASAEFVIRATARLPDFTAAEIVDAVLHRARELEGLPPADSPAPGGTDGDETC